MEKFELLLKNEKVRSYNRISTLIIIINLALFILFAINLKEKSTRIISVVAAVILMASLLLPLLAVKTKSKTYSVYKSIAMYSAVIAWIAMGYWWIGIACALLSLLYRISIKPVVIFFYRDKINYSSLLMRTILWNELSNVILKDGILTIDYKNNKLLQVEVDDTSADISEKEFNDFCKQQIAHR